MNKKKQKKSERMIADNRKARHDYAIDTRFEAGIALEGWEVKSLRAGRVQLKESYILLKKGEAWLIGAHISPLKHVASHIEPDPTRTRKLLLHQKELAKIFASVQQKGNSAVALNLHWTRNRVKVEVALGKGKKVYDKRETIKKKDIDREQGRILKR
jgi:SsrA-binding protein